MGLSTGGPAGGPDFSERVAEYLTIKDRMNAAKKAGDRGMIAACEEDYRILDLKCQAMGGSLKGMAVSPLSAEFRAIQIGRTTARMDRAIAELKQLGKWPL